MRKYNAQLIDIKSGEILFTGDSISVVFVDVALSSYDKSIEEARDIARVGWNMYLKDSNNTNVGKLADFLCEVEDFDTFKELGTYEQLARYYYE